MRAYERVQQEQNPGTVCWEDFHGNVQLGATDERPEESHHAQEFDATAVLHGDLLAHVGHGVEDGADEDQAVAEDNVTGCEEDETRRFVFPHRRHTVRDGGDSLEPGSLPARVSAPTMAPTPDKHISTATKWSGR